MYFDEKELGKVEQLLKEKRESVLSDSLDKALKQVEEGKVIPHSEVRRKYEKWL
ncbi:MAG: hypothetical protein AAF363_16270 [Bacteroidota bacterium]